MFPSVQDLYDGTAKSIAFATTPKNKLKNRFTNICVCKWINDIDIML